MRYCLARLLFELHAALTLLMGRQHWCVRMCYHDPPDYDEYLWCRCGRIFWPPDVQEAERRTIERLNRATRAEPYRCRSTQRPVPR